MIKLVPVLSLSMAFLLSKSGTASPMYMTDLAKLCVFPHLVGISDFICSGTAVSTNDGFSADFAVDEILWGNPSSPTNVHIRNLTPQFGIDFLPGEKYLVFAFTNNWWFGGRESYRQSFVSLSHFLPATNRPPSGACFDDYRIIEKHRCAIPFRLINYGGTNYWGGTRTIITNLIDVGRIQCDEGRVREIIESIIHDENNLRQLPLYVRRQMILYKHFRYDFENLATMSFSP